MAVATKVSLLLCSLEAGGALQDWAALMAEEGRCTSSLLLPPLLLLLLLLDLSSLPRKLVPESSLLLVLFGLTKLPLLVWIKLLPKLPLSLLVVVVFMRPLLQGNSAYSYPALARPRLGLYPWTFLSICATLGDPEAFPRPSRLIAELVADTGGGRRVLSLPRICATLRAPGRGVGRLGVLLLVVLVTTEKVLLGAAGTSAQA
jgi:hypothetical protein